MCVSMCVRERERQGERGSCAIFYVCTCVVCAASVVAGANI